ncbi:MAG TPA: SDR family NAD(P)-dependent oxidoreductase [Acidobacteriaceae bacterium]|nr:SDR family NAD(P)-dependent oxidoreductase [Acidobacteriaceae bacterium]
MESVIGRQQQTALQGQVAIVTGAARGIGRAVAGTLAGMGAKVGLLARDRAALEKVKAEIDPHGGTAVVMTCDLRDAQAIAALGERVRAEFGRCDILVNNAGVGAPGKPLVELTPEEWGLVMDTNLRAPFLMIRALAPMMIAANSGHIVNISSLAGKNPLPNGAAYAASKWGLNGLTYSVAEELRQFNVRASVIAPGSVDTSFGGGHAPGQGKNRSRMVQPADVAAVVACLVTQAPNSFVSEVLLRPTMKP